MMKFSSVSDYLEALRAGRASAILPLSLVAEHFDVTRAAIDRMVNMEYLSSIKIGSSRFVDVQSLTKLEDKRRKDVEKVRKFLEERARAGQHHIFYDPVMTSIGRSWKVPADRTYIGKVLGDISTSTERENGTLLTVLVHRKTLGKTRPGPGFFGLAKSFDRKWENEDEFIEEETRRVLRQYKR